MKIMGLSMITPALISGILLSTCTAGSVLSYLDFYQKSHESHHPSTDSSS